MKTILLVIIVITCSLFFFGCSVENSNTNTLGSDNLKEILQETPEEVNENSNINTHGSDSLEDIPQEIPEEVNEKIKQSIVWVKYEVTSKNEDGSYFESGGTGSGVIAKNEDNELTVYTNRHVVDCQYNDIQCFQRLSEDIQVRTQDGKLHKVDTVSFSESDIDLAILTIKSPNAASYSVALYTPDFKIGEEVIAVGYPSYAENVVEFSVSEGRITNIKEVLSQSSGKNFRAIESDAYTYFGSSGGGLFNTQGNLVGINTWGATGQGVAIDVSSINEESFTYCNKDSYLSNDYCQNYCEREQVLGSDRRCYDVCEGFYCNSQIPQVNDPSCESGYIQGSDGYCHLPCGSAIEYCSGSDSICLNNRCYSQCSQGSLWEDGTCRVYE